MSVFIHSELKIGDINKRHFRLKSKLKIMNQFNQNKATWDRNYNRGKVKSHSRNLPINEFDSLGKHDFWLHVYCVNLIAPLDYGGTIIKLCA